MVGDTPRQFVLDALRHRTPAAVPIDIGGTTVTTVVDGAYDRLKTHLGIRAETQYMFRRSREVLLDEAALVRLGSCARPVFLGLPDEAWILDDDGAITDEWGVTWRSAGGHFNPVVSPLADANVADLATYPWPDPDDPGRTRGLQEAAAQLHADGTYAVVLSLSAGVVHLSQFVRGFDQYLIDLVADRAFADRLMGRVLDVYLRIIDKALSAVQGVVDVVMYGDDLAFQDRLMVRPDVYRTIIKPRHKEIVDLIKASTGAAVLFHSCGAIAPIIGDLIELGVDALTPVQVSAAGMGDTAALKKEFGRDITFWGGIDTQRVLPFGRPNDVREEVRRRIADMATDGGYVISAVHNIQDDVDPRNIVALADAAREFGVSV